MTKQECLQAMMLLSALESWSFLTDKPLPDYLHDNLISTVNALEKAVLSNENTLSPQGPPDGL